MKNSLLLLVAGMTLFLISCFDHKPSKDFTFLEGVIFISSGWICKTIEENR